MYLYLGEFLITYGKLEQRKRKFWYLLRISELVSSAVTSGKLNDDIPVTTQ